MVNEEEVLLLPGLPLVNRPGETHDGDLWTFEVETPEASFTDASEETPRVMIDYAHPGFTQLLL